MVSPIGAEVVARKSLRDCFSFKRQHHRKRRREFGEASFKAKDQLTSLFGELKLVLAPEAAVREEKKKGRRSERRRFPSPLLPQSGRRSPRTDAKGTVDNSIWHC
jgi:hypothetical protein